MRQRRRDRIDRDNKDKEWSKTIKDYYGNKCIICGSNKLLNAHHIIPREFQETRWDTLNGVPLCISHHKYSKFSAHKNGWKTKPTDI